MASGLFRRLGYSIPERVDACAHVGESRTTQDNPFGLREIDTEQILDNAYALHEARVSRSKQSNHILEIFAFLQPLARLGDHLVVPAIRHMLRVMTEPVLGKSFRGVAGQLRWQVAFDSVLGG
ncbi:hypothetical protein Rhe02_73010 [Rhizocola hellebori]|uniref:Uncharacterized protein n=1 Tax=Rhizocola hellebori TaxID=1392758 RepID=A0A8J3VJA9_9ACTN|nr:hypothetical protein [Rhizocola hellebori]GIH09234.1 hypothetical protein Rhe02_73010 [Rhizocola hellebori]